MDASSLLSALGSIATGLTGNNDSQSADGADGDAANLFSSLIDGADGDQAESLLTDNAEMARLLGRENPLLAAPGAVAGLIPGSVGAGAQLSLSLLRSASDETDLENLLNELKGEAGEDGAAFDPTSFWLGVQPADPATTGAAPAAAGLRSLFGVSGNGANAGNAAGTVTADGEAIDPSVMEPTAEGTDDLHARTTASDQATRELFMNEWRRLASGQEIQFDDIALDLKSERATGGTSTILREGAAKLGTEFANDPANTADRQQTNARGDTGFAQALDRANSANSTQSVQRSDAPRANGPAEQVSFHIQRAAASGVDRITIQLQPQDLGRVNIELELGDDAHIRALITADRPETLEALQRDARALERAARQCRVPPR